jgi:hypothetical protein
MENIDIKILKCYFEKYIYTRFLQLDHFLLIAKKKTNSLKEKLTQLRTDNSQQYKF